MMSWRETKAQEAARKRVRNARIRNVASKVTPLDSGKAKRNLRNAKVARKRAR